MRKQKNLFLTADEFRIEKKSQNVYNNIEVFYLLTLFWREYYEKEKDWRLIGAG